MLDANNQELKMLKTAAGEFARKVLAPERENFDQYPFGPDYQPVLAKAFALDFFHLTLPEDLGGIGQKQDGLCRFLAAICSEDSSLGGYIIVNAVSQRILSSGGHASGLKEIVANAEDVGQMLIAFPAFRNPSERKPDVRAVISNGCYRLSGRVEYLSLGGIAKYALIPAMIDKVDGYTFFLIQLDRQGVVASQPVVSLGLRACPAVDLDLNHKEAVIIGQEGEGASLFGRIYPSMAVAAASMALGMMQGAFREALQYTRKREQGGRKISKWAEVQMMLANMSIKIEMAETALLQACQLIENEAAGWRKKACAVAVMIHEMACDVTSEGIQLLGGNGYMKDFGQEKRFRDAKHLQAFLGLHPMKKIRYFRQYLSREEK